MKTLLASLALACLGGCGPAPAPADKAASPSPSPPPVASPVADTWLGHWNGPEGLFLDLAAGTEPGRYKMTLKDNLDTQADYDAETAGSGLVFMRGGKPVAIRAGTGAETGFKYLADKTDCLILVVGQEGYCRD